MAFLGLYIFASTFMVCDLILFLNGYKSLMFKAKTDEEKAVHQARIKRLKGESCDTESKK